MTDTIKTRSQLVTSLASTGAETVTAQTLRNWLISSTLALIPTGTKTANYTAVESDFVPCDASGGSFTLTLPSAPQDKTVVGAKLINESGSHTVTIACGGSDVFNKSGGSTSATLSLLNQGIQLQYKATGGIWYVVGDDLPVAAVNGLITTALGSYLPLAGGTMTGPIDFSNGSVTGALQASGFEIQLNSNLYVTFNCSGVYCRAGFNLQGNTIDMGGGAIQDAGSMQSVGPVTVGTFTTGTLPTEADGALIYVSDAPGVYIGVSGSWLRSVTYDGSGNLAPVGPINMSAPVNMNTSAINLDGASSIVADGAGGVTFATGGALALNPGQITINGNATFNGSGSYTSFTIVNGLITSAS